MIHDNSESVEEILNQAETKDAEVASDPASSVNRRTFLGASAASLMGMALTQMSTESADAQAIGSHKQSRSSMMVLPNAVAAQLAPLFLKNSPDLTLLYQNFASQGMKFIPERAIVAVFEDEGDAGTAPGGPCMLLIWPTFRTFNALVNPIDPSHEAASIVAIQKCGTVGGVMASHVVVNHNPFQISQFNVLDIDKSTTPPQIVSHGATRDEVKTKTVAQLIALLGPPPIDPTTVSEMPSLTIANMKKLASGTFAELLNDSYANPLYPALAISTLLKDSSLVVKWSDAQRLRYSAVFSGMICCCSTSSNGCTSTSSSFSFNLSA